MTRFRAILAWFLTMLMLATPFADAQEATPIIEDDAPVVMGSIAVDGLNGGAAPQYTIVDAEGMVLASGTLESSFIESPNLVATAGSSATIIVVENESYQPISTTVIADDSGALHFVVQLVSAEQAESPNVDDGEAGEIQVEGAADANSPVRALDTDAKEIKLTITAMTPGGEVPAEVSFNANSNIGDDYFWIDGRTNSEGMAYVEMAPGDYTITVLPEGRFLGGTYNYTVDSETTEIAISIDVAESTGFVQFNVTFAADPSDTGGYMYVYSDSNRTYTADLTSQNPTILELPVGEYTYDAHPNDSFSYQSSYGGFTVTEANDDTSPAQVGIHFAQNPTIEFFVVDSDSIPIAGVEVELGSLYGGDFSTSTTLETDINGHFALPLPDWVTHWRILPFDLWQGASGSVSSPSTSITLNPLTDYGTVTYVFSHDDGEYLYGASVSGAHGDYYVYQFTENSNEISMYLPAGDWELLAETSSWGYYTAEVNFSLQVGDELVIPVVFESWPEHTFEVQDEDGNPIGGTHVYVGYINNGDFYSYGSAYIDESGSGVTRIPDDVIRWNIAPFDLWQGATGLINVDTDSTQVVLQSVSESGTLKIDATDSNVPWFDINIYGDAGWTKWITFDSYYMDDLVAEFALPTGEYSWTANAGIGYHELSGEFTIDVDGHHDLGTLTFEQQPSITITVIDQNNNPVPDVRIVLEMQEEPWAIGEVTSDVDGVAFINLPLGRFSYSIDAPAKYQRHADGVLEHESADGSTLSLQLELLPNGTLQINVIASDDYPIDQEIVVQDGDGNSLTSTYVRSAGQIDLTEFPYGSDYSVYMPGSFWYPETSGEKFDFGVDTGPVSIVLTPYEAVQLNVEVSSTSASPIRGDFELNFEQANGWFGSWLWVSADDDGSYGGTLALPRSEYTVYAHWWDETTSPDLPLALDLTEVTSPHSINLRITPPPGGKPVFTISTPEGFSADGEITILQNETFVTSAWIDSESATATTFQVLDAGTYTWTYTPGGALQPASGTFTITEGDVNVPVDLKIGLNGVIIVNGDFPEGLDNLERNGWVEVLDSNGITLASRIVPDLTMFAIGPVTYGDVTLRIYPWDSRLASPVEIDITVNADEVNTSVVLAQRTVPDPVMLTITVTSESGDPIRDGQILANGETYEIGDDGTAQIDVAELDSLYLTVTSVNFETVYEYWSEADGLNKTVQLGEQMPVLELTVQNEESAAIPGLVVEIAECYGTQVGTSDGLYLFRLVDQSATECEVSITDWTGQYQPIENEVVPITGLVTQVTLTMIQQPNLVSNVEVHLDIEGGMPEIDWDAGEVLQVQLTSVDGLIWVYADIDNNGVATFPVLQSGEYFVVVFGSWNGWMYDTSAFYDTSVEVIASGQVINVTISKVPLVPLTIRIETLDGLALEDPVMVEVSGGAYLDVMINVPGEATIYLPEGGAFNIWTDGASLYRQDEALRISELADAQNVTITLSRISSIAVPIEPEPTATPTVTPTAETTPDATITPTAETTPDATVTPTADTTPDVTVTPTEDTTPDATVTPTETVNPEIPVQLGDKELIVRLQIHGGLNIQGSPYRFYSTMAAQFAAEPLLQGVVGPNNTISITGLIPGIYRLVVEPVGIVPIDVLIEVSDDPVTEAFIVRLEENGETTVSYAGQQPSTPLPDTGDVQESTPGVPGSTASATATSDTKANADAGVTGLPSTGAGRSAGIGYSIAILLAAAAVSFILIPFGIKKNHHHRH